jgi:hypothetical protein
MRALKASRFRQAVHILSLCSGIVACGDDAEGEPWLGPPDASDNRDAGDDDDGVSYGRDVRPIFQRCVICHHPGGIIGNDLVNPFDPKSGIIGRPNSWRAEGHDSPFEVIVKPGEERQLLHRSGRADFRQ